VNDRAEEFHRNDKKQEQHEVDVISRTDCAANPHAEMIESEHAATNLMTVLRAGWPSYHASVTDFDVSLPLIYSLQELLLELLALSVADGKRPLYRPWPYSNSAIRG
jgi:hypothetical protein